MFKRSPLTLSEPVGIKSGLNLHRYFLTFDNVSGEIVIVKGVTGSGCVLFMMSGAWLEAWRAEPTQHYQTVSNFSPIDLVGCNNVLSHSLQSSVHLFRLLTLREDLNLDEYYSVKLPQIQPDRVWRNSFRRFDRFMVHLSRRN